jgi:peptidoglycan-N-acetylglucosamine deacetylase
VKRVFRTVHRLARTGLGAVLPSSRFLVSGPRAGGAVCLTFDDGPHPEHTPAVLDILARERVRATFFVIGRRAARYPDVIRRMAAEGHAVGHHTYAHSDPSITSAARLAAEIGVTGRVLYRVIGYSPLLFRPPHGRLTPAKLWRVWKLGMTVALWNVDPRDYACGSADELRGRLRAHSPRAGDVFLFHDDRPHACGALPELIARVRDDGLSFATVPEWVDRQASRRRPVLLALPADAELERRSR